jgi:hypothetical protein
VEYKTFLIESYFRKVGEVWVYSMKNCTEEFQAEFPNFAVLKNAVIYG